MGRHYTLAEDGRTPEPCDNDLDWARWMDHARMTGRLHVGDVTNDAGVRVSTVFLGIDRAFGGGDPVLWETLVFMPDGEDGERYTSHADAVAGHARYVAKHHGGSEVQS